MLTYLIFNTQSIYEGHVSTEHTSSNYKSTSDSLFTIVTHITFCWNRAQGEMKLNEPRKEKIRISESRAKHAKLSFDLHQALKKEPLVALGSQTKADYHFRVRSTQLRDTCVGGVMV